MATDPIDLDAVAEELRELDKKVVSAPWERNGCEIEKWADLGVGSECILYISDEGGHDEDDARLIVAMRNALPALLEERKRHREQLRQAEIVEAEADRRISALEQQLAEARAACSALYHFMQRENRAAPGGVDQVIGLAHKVIPEEVERDQEEQRRIRRG